MFKKVIVLGISAGVLLGGCIFSDLLPGGGSKPQSLPGKEITLQTAGGNIKIKAEVADTKEERESGLMHRKKLETNSGMLFVFEDESPRRFWMKNTLVPLDILFLDRSRKIVKIIEYMEPCRQEQCPIYDSEAAAMYALEVPAGFAREHSLALGGEMVE